MNNDKQALLASEAALPLQNDIALDPSVSKGIAPLVPIRSLGERHRDQIIAHLLLLDESDRYLRFGFFAKDEHVIRYAEGIDFAHDEMLGITNRKLSLIAVAHLAFAPPDRKTACAELGVSVTKSARGRGFGARLFDRAAMDARNQGVSLMFIHALTENKAMLAIARKAGAILERHGSETEAYLRLPPASFNSRLAEIVEQHYAQIDFRLKSQTHQLRDVLTAITTWQRGGSSNRQER